MVEVIWQHIFSLTPHTTASSPANLEKWYSTICWESGLPPLSSLLLLSAFFGFPLSLYLSLCIYILYIFSFFPHSPSTFISLVCFLISLFSFFAFNLSLSPFPYSEFTFPHSLLSPSFFHSSFPPLSSFSFSFHLPSLPLHFISPFFLPSPDQMLQLTMSSSQYLWSIHL